MLHMTKSLARYQSFELQTFESDDIEEKSVLFNCLANTVKFQIMLTDYLTDVDIIFPLLYLMKN